MTLKFNCGEFRPGKKPKRSSGSKPVIPPIIIVKGDPLPKDPPWSKDPPNKDEGYKCISRGVLTDCPPDKPNLVKAGLSQRCAKCTPQEVLMGICTSLAVCKATCLSFPAICAPSSIIVPPVIIPPGGGGGVTIPPQIPASGIGGTPIGSPPTGTTPPGGGTQLPWKCVEEVLFKECQSGYKVEGSPYYTKRKCIQCTVDDLRKRDPLCLAGKTQAQCMSECNSDPEPTCIPDTDPNNSETIIVPKSGILKEPEVVDLKDLSKKSSSGDYDTIYDVNFNFMNWPDSVESQTKSNSNNLNIFKEEIDENVEYILRNTGTAVAWNELALASLTMEGIKNSIRPELLEAFGYIKHLGGQPVGENFFLGAIRDLLLSDRLDEFDAAYIINLGSIHASEEKVIFTPTTSKSLKDQAALGFVAEDSFPTDPEQNEEDAKQFQRRARALNEDIGLVMMVDDCSGGTIFVDASNAGMVVDTCDEVKFAMLGDGDGYYFSANCDEKVIDTSSSILSAYSLPPDSRFNALTVMGEDPDYHLSVTGQSGATEVNSDYDLGTDIGPLFFEINLSTVGQMETVNSLVVNTSAEYDLVTDPDLIEQATHNNGWTATVAQVDYNDPFLVYANDSSSMSIQFKDISFLNFSPQVDIFQDTRLPRNVPFIIILSPGRGTKHNPFSGRSKITSMGDDVVRSLTMIPGLEKEDGNDDYSPLEYVYAYDETGVAGYGKVGEENLDPDNVLFKFETSATVFQNTYYDGTYSSSQPTRTRSATGVMFGVIDSLISTYSPEFLTWFDVGRRLKLGEYNELALELTEDVKFYLAKGNKGIRVVDVLSKTPVVSTGITSEITDTVILEDTDRELDRIVI